VTVNTEQLEGLGTYEYGWADKDTAGATARRGLNEEVVRDISAKKSEPQWMLDMRLKGLRLFGKKPMPTFGADLSGIDFDNIKYFVRSTEKQATSWEELPEDIKNTYDRLGIPEAEKQRLVAGVAAQYESEVVYHKIREDLEEQGVIFLDTDTGLREHEELFKEYFGTVIPVGDNKFAALNTAVWSGGSFIYVPPGVNVEIPLQSYFRINTENMGQFERTLIIVDEGAYVHYVEGCTAPIYSSDSLLSAVVEIIVKKDARCRYTTIRAHVTEHLGFARIASIEPHEVEPVYDVEVDGPHNFVAEGIVVHNSEVVYHKIREDLEEQGVIFLDTDTGLKEHEELFKEYFGSVIPVGDNKFAALNTAVWSGGSFIYVPKGVHVEIPLQAYFRINTENMGQFERTLIIVDEGAYVHYVEGCTAPIYSSDSLHSAVVEIIVKKDARCRYTTIQNWSNNVYNLVTKRAVAHEGATMEWIDGNIGSKVTMKYPAVWLMGPHAKGETLSIAFAGEGQHQDAGSKMVHAAPYTSSAIVSKSVARGGGRTSYRGLVQVQEQAHHSKSTVRCDALLVDDISRSDTYPYVDVRVDDVAMGHEATVSKVSEDQLFYLMSRGLTEEEAMAMIVRGFVEPIARELPMEYALELNRLIELQMEGAVG